MSIDHLLIGISGGFQDQEKFSTTLDKLLLGQVPSKLTLINHSNEFLQENTFNKNLKPQLKMCRSRLEARGLVKRASHVLVFWSGEDLHNIIWEARNQKKPLRISTFSYTRAVNKDAGDEFDVYIGRGGPWGNPFPIVPGTDQTREEVISKYAKYFEEEIVNNPAKKKAVLELRGLRLGCHCKPEACHGDVIARYLNNYRDDEADDTDGCGVPKLPKVSQ